MASTRAHEQMMSTKPATPAPDQGRASRNAVSDGTIHIPRYTATFEKPGYAGHIPQEMAHDTNVEEAKVKLLRDVPGYTGNIPGKMNRMGRPKGMIGRMAV